MSLLSTCRSTAPAPARMMTSAVPFLILFLVGVSFAERYWVDFGARRRALGIATLPVAQFPDIAPPSVYVSIAYPGASAKVLTDSVLIPLEQSINGVQGMRYIVSDATSAGEATIRIFFEPGTDSNINVVNVQNRVNIMTSRLPELVVREGILVSQVVPSMLMYLNLYSTDPNTDQKDLFNYANVYVMPVLKRIKGMGIPVNLGNRTLRCAFG